MRFAAGIVAFVDLVSVLIVIFVVFSLVLNFIPWRFLIFFINCKVVIDA